MVWLCFRELREMLLVVAWAHQGIRVEVWGAGDGATRKWQEMTASLKLQWFRVRKTGWGAESPTWWDFHTSWGAELNGRLDPARIFGWRYGGFGICIFNEDFQWYDSCESQSANSSLQEFLSFSINHLNIDFEPLSHWGGRKFDPIHSSFSLASCQDSWFWDFCHLMLSPYCPSQLVPLRSAVWSHLSHLWVWGSWKGLKS